MIRAVVIASALIIVGAAGEARADCKRGKVVMRFDVGGTVEVESGGAWRSAAGSGCLRGERWRRVQAAVKQAETTDVAKGAFVASGTATAITCVVAAIDGDQTDREVAFACGPAACRRGAKLLFRVSGQWDSGGDPWSPSGGVVMRSPDAPPSRYEPRSPIEIDSAGGWSRGDAGRGGCLDAKSLALLQRTLRGARFRVAKPPAACTDGGEVLDLYEGPTRKQRASVAIPCGGEIDAGTALAARCLDAVTSARLGAMEIDDACND